jgi:hypothetical protein
MVSEKMLIENQIEEWMDSNEAARYLRISTKSLMNLTSNGKVIYYKFGRRNRYLLSDLRKLLFSQKRGFYGNKI